MVACLGVALSGAALWIVQYQLKAHSYLEFEWVAHNRIGVFRQGIENGLNAVRTVRDFYLASEDVPEDQFRSFALSTMARYRGIQALMWVPHVPQRKSDSGEAVDQDAHGPFHIAQQARSDRMLSAQHRDPRFPVQYVEPRENNERYLGIDLASDPVHMEYLERARMRAQMVVSGRTELLLAPGTHHGVLAYLPVFANDTSALKVARERKDLRGYAVGIFRLDDLAEASVALLEPRGVEFMIRDESASEQQQFLGFYASRLDPQDGAPTLVPGNGNQVTGLRFKQIFPVADRQWSITCAQTPQFKSAIAFQKSEWFVMGVGLLFTMLDHGLSHHQ